MSEWRINLGTVSGGGACHIVRLCEHPRDGSGNTKDVECKHCLNRSDKCKMLTVKDTEDEAREALEGLKNEDVRII